MNRAWGMLRQAEEAESNASITDLYIASEQADCCIF
jgi:hypothetical protein